MVTLPTETQLKKLDSLKSPLTLSVYIPFSQSDSSNLKARKIELKNIHQEAVRLGAKLSEQQKEVQKILQKLTMALDAATSSDSGRNQGLAVFATPNQAEFYYLPIEQTPYILSFAPVFNLDPIHEMYEKNEAYYLLTIGHKNIRFFKADNYSIEELHPKGMPSNLETDLHIDEYHKSRETHAIKPASSGKGSRAYHEQYDVSKEQKRLLLSFFHLIDSRLHKYLRYDHTPLLLAGVDYLLPIYRKANTYGSVFDKSLKGNFDKVSASTLHLRAQALTAESI